MKYIFFALSLLTMLFIGCKKDKSPEIISEKFMSLSSGSTWAYETQNNITATSSTNTVTSSSKDSVINGKTYHVFLNSNGSPNDYYNITGTDYFTFRNLGLAAGNVLVESIYLKDNAAVGITWSQVVNLPLAGFPSPIPVTYTNVITAKGISKTVNGKSYSNVTHTTTTIAVAGLPPGSIITDIQSFYAPNVGLIESRNKIILSLLSININQSTILKSSTIK